MYPQEFTYKVVKLQDTEESNIKDEIPAAIEFIRENIVSGKKILVHCFAGKSRSASVVIAYLMKYNNMNLGEALHYVR